jgi:catalase
MQIIMFNNNNNHTPPRCHPSFIHTQKRHPATHLKDPDAFWDFISLRPETIHQVSFLFSNRGTPDGYRFMNGYGSHAFVNVNDLGDVHYVKYHFKTDQGIRNLAAVEADQLAASDPDYATRDLYQAIAQGDFPAWTLYVQVMTPAQAAACPFDPFDLTKVWPHAQYPLHPVGRIVLNENPVDYFCQIEQLAFSPSHLVPGIEPSCDKMLQARLFAYPDTHRHRLGANYLQLPCNNGGHQVVTGQHHYQRDGPMAYQIPNGGPNYYPNSFGGPQPDPVAGRWHSANVSGKVGRYETGSTEDNFSQCRDFYHHVPTAEERDDLTTNLANHLCYAQEFIQQNVLRVLRQVDATYAAQVAEKIRSLPLPPTRQAPPPPAPLNPPRHMVGGAGCPYSYQSKL